MARPRWTHPEIPGGAGRGPDLEHTVGQLIDRLIELLTPVHPEGEQRPNPRALLRLAEAAELLGVGRTTVYAMVSHHELPVVRFGRVIRVPRDELLDWIQKQLEQPRPKPAAPALPDWLARELRDKDSGGG